MMDCYIGISTSVGDLHWNRRPPFGETSTLIDCGAYFDALLSQASKAVSAGQDTLANIFERMENVFRRLETYVKVPPTTGMTDIIVKIMVEVLCILSIATKEMKQSRASELIPDDMSCPRQFMVV